MVNVRKKPVGSVQWPMIWRALCIALLLSACSTLRDPPSVLESEVDSVPLTTLSLPPRSDTAPRSSRAVDQLLSAAERALLEQQYDRAAALTERAIRLAAKDPRGYFSLAQIRYRQGQFGQAQSLLEKAHLLATSDTAMLMAIDALSRALSRVMAQ